MKNNKKLWLTLIVFALVTGLTFNACKKDDTDDDSKAPSTTTEKEILSQQANDEEDFQVASDNADETADKVMGSIVATAKGTTIEKPCDATIDSSLFVSNKQITITFNGANCNGNGIIRTGKIIIKLTTGIRWVDVNAVLTVTYENFSVTRRAKTIVINGTKTHTNISGGVISQVSPEKTIIHKVVSSNMKCKINNATERTWNVNRLKTFTKDGGYTKLALSGEGISGNHSNLVTWGINRAGKEFFTKIQTPIVISTECTAGPKSGVKVHHVGTDRTLTTTFGLNSSGVAVTTGCPTHFKIAWVVAGKPDSTLIAY